MKNQYIKIQKIQYFQNLFVGVTFKKQRRSYRDGSILFLAGVTKNDILFLRITNETNIGANLSEGWIVKMNDKWLEFAMRIHSIAQAGLQYGKEDMILNGMNSCALSPRKCIKTAQAAERCNLCDCESRPPVPVPHARFSHELLWFFLRLCPPLHKEPYPQLGI